MLDPISGQDAIELAADLGPLTVPPTVNCGRNDHGALGYHRHVHFDSVGQPARVASRGQAALATFCDGWMRNIASQQGLVLS